MRVLPWKVDPRLWPQSYIVELRERMRGRTSWFRSRRRRAYAAVLELIRWHEANLWPEPVSGTLPCDRPRHPGEPETVTADGHDWRTGDFYEPHRCETTTIGRREVVVRPDPDCRTHGLPAGTKRVPHLRRHAAAGEDDRTVEARLYGEATRRVVYRYRWGNNPRRAELKGRECVIEARGKLGTVLLRFLDTGERVTTSARAVRRIRRA